MTTKTDPTNRAILSLSGRPWAMLDEATVLAELASLAAGYSPARESRVDGLEANGVAVVEVAGPISRRGAGAWSSAEKIGREIDAAANDPDVGSIVIAIDSPGGSVYGIAAVGDKIVSARGKKLVVGVATPMAASAAYWIGSQCSELVVEQGGEVGSIGVFNLHVDYSKQLAQEGIKVTAVKAAKNKAERAPFVSLSEDAKAYMQQEVDAYYVDFLSAVSRGRGVSVSYAASEAFGQGRMVGAREAVKAGLADRVESLESVLGRLSAMTSDQASQLMSACEERCSRVQLLEAPVIPVGSTEQASTIFALGAVVAREQAKQEERHAAATKENEMNEDQVKALLAEAVGGAVKSLEDKHAAQIAGLEARVKDAETKAAEVAINAEATTKAGREALATQQLDALVRDYKITAAEKAAELALFAHIPDAVWQERIKVLNGRAQDWRALTEPATFRTDGGESAQVDARDYSTPQGGRVDQRELALIAQAQAETKSTDPKIYAPRLKQLADAQGIN